MAQKQGISSTAGGRVDGSIGTAISASNIALGVGWGDGNETAVTVATGSNDQRGKLTVLSDGASQAQATATVILTFVDGAFVSAPFTIVTTTNDNDIETGHVTWATTTTTMTLTHSVQPVDTKSYVFTYLNVA